MNPAAEPRQHVAAGVSQIGEPTKPPSREAAPATGPPCDSLASPCFQSVTIEKENTDRTPAQLLVETLRPGRSCATSSMVAVPLAFRSIGGCQWRHSTRFKRSLSHWNVPTGSTCLCVAHADRWVNNAGTDANALRARGKKGRRVLSSAAVVTALEWTPYHARCRRTDPATQ